jgi:hypothetical protein
MPARAEAFDEVERIECSRLVADQDGVEYFVAELCQAGCDANRFFEHYFGRAIGGERFGQPSAGSMQRSDVQNLDPSRHLAPDFGCDALGRIRGG